MTSGDQNLISLKTDPSLTDEEHKLEEQTVQTTYRDSQALPFALSQEVHPFNQTQKLPVKEPKHKFRPDHLPPRCPAAQSTHYTSEEQSMKERWEKM